MLFLTSNKDGHEGNSNSKSTAILVMYTLEAHYLDYVLFKTALTFIGNYSRM